MNNELMQEEMIHPNEKFEHDKLTIRLLNVKVSPHIRSLKLRIKLSFKYIMTWVFAFFCLIFRILWFAIYGNASIGLLSTFVMVVVVTIYVLINIDKSYPVDVDFCFSEECLTVRSLKHEYAKDVFVDGVFRFSYDDIIRISYDKDEREFVIFGNFSHDWHVSGEMIGSEPFKSKGVKQDQLILSLACDDVTNLNTAINRYSNCTVNYVS